MTLGREETVAGLAAELADFEALVRALDERAWATPTRCDGWTVADVAAHVAGTLTDILAGRFEGLGSPEVTEREVVERRGRSSAELADELVSVGKQGVDVMSSFDDDAWIGPAPGGIPGTLGAGVEALWYDAFLHANDIRSALGRPEETGPGIRAAVSHVAAALTDRAWGPATLQLADAPGFTVGGGGPTLTGDALTFVLVGTGRADPSSLGLDDTVNIYR